MTLLPSAGRVPEWSVRDRLRKAREDAFPDMEKLDFAQLIGLGKNIVTAYEGRNGTREENMKDLVLRRWAEVTSVDFGWLKYGEPGEGDPEGGPSQGRYVGPTGIEPMTSTVEYGRLAPVTDLIPRAA